MRQRWLLFRQWWLAEVNIKRQYAVLAIIGVLLLAVGGTLLFSRQAPEQTPTPAPTPAPSPLPATTDEPRWTVEEACAYVSNRLPSKLPSVFKKAEVFVVERSCFYEGDGKWLFTALLSALETGTERKFDYYTPEGKVVIGGRYFYRTVIKTYDLAVEGNYFEKIGVVEITYIDQLNVRTVRTEWE